MVSVLALWAARGLPPPSVGLGAVLARARSLVREGVWLITLRSCGLRASLRAAACARRGGGRRLRSLSSPARYELACRHGPSCGRASRDAHEARRARRSARLRAVFEAEAMLEREARHASCA